MLPKTICIEKRVGQTPLEALDEFRGLHPEFVGVPLAYAGRLDPMASGKLLVLVGEECKQQELYRGLDKEYEVEVLLGFGSDTGDVLGIVNGDGQGVLPEEKALRQTLRKEIGCHERPYPAYSSKTVDGVPLFYRSLEGTLPNVLPTHIERVYRIELLSVLPLSKTELEERVREKLALAPTSNEPSKALGADFRIDAVRNSWNEALSRHEGGVTVVTLRVTAGSGTYMRALAERIGSALSVRGLAFSIHRTKMGRYTPALHWWRKRY